MINLRSDKVIHESVAGVIAEMGVQDRPRSPSTNLAKLVYPAFVKFNEALSQALGAAGTQDMDIAQRTEQIINVAILQLGKISPEVQAALKGAEGTTFTSPLEALRKAAMGEQQKPQQQQQPEQKSQQNNPEVAKPSENKPLGQGVAQGVPGPVSRSGG